MTAFEDTPEERERRKRAMYEAMGERRKKYVHRIGYDKWDPFAEPKDPIDIRRDVTRRTSQQLIREFLQSLESDSYSSAFGQGAFEMCLGVVNEDERILGMFRFALWYDGLLKREGRVLE